LKGNRCAFLTHSGTHRSYDDPLLAELLESRGWSVAYVDWRAPTAPWSAFDCAILRSPWNYYHFADEFLATLKAIDASGCRLINPLSAVLATIDKRYLAHWQTQGVPTIPTLWMEFTSDDRSPEVTPWFEGLQHSFDPLRCDELIVKPVISAGSCDTYRIHRSRLETLDHSIRIAIQSKTMMVQAYLDTIETEGEYSIIFLDGEYSHAVRKVPKSGDFRVQLQHGGQYRLDTPDRVLVEQSKDILENRKLPGLSERPLYARFDWVRAAKGSRAFYLMEAELIEPDLYLRLAPPSLKRFVNALERFQSDLRD
jgi:hypothetical protein